jgi:hypothetical protein
MGDPLALPQGKWIAQLHFFVSKKRGEPAWTRLVQFAERFKS